MRKREAASSIDFDYAAGPEEKETYRVLLGAKSVDSVNVGGKISQRNGLVAVDYAIEASFATECARCGCECAQSLVASGEKYLADKSEEDEKEGEDFFVTEIAGIFDTEDFAVEFLGLEVPYRYLCSEDCRGLCENCGADLNEGECSCPKKAKNPAFDILDGFFK